MHMDVKRKVCKNEEWDNQSINLYSNPLIYKLITRQLL